MHYYDPWAHSVRIFMHRVMLFVSLTVLLSILTWGWILKHFFGVGWGLVFETLWALLWGNLELKLALMLGLTVACSALATTTLFVLLIKGGQLKHGERHHRGSRVVQNTYQNN